MDKIYKRYLRCKHWQQVRQQALTRAEGHCEKCGYEPWKPGTLQVHHKTYANVGCESMEDVIVLCPRCHMEIHGIERKNRAHFKK